MPSPVKTIKVESLLSLGEDLVGVLNMHKDDEGLMHCNEGLRTLRSSCRQDSLEVLGLIQEHEKKRDAYKEKIQKVKEETVDDDDLERLQGEYEDKLQTERLLRQELREVGDELDILEQQRMSFEERKQQVREREEGFLRAENLLSMCASVTNVIPNLEDESKISGLIFDKKKKKAEKFEFDPESTSLEVCDKLWRLADV